MNNNWLHLQFIKTVDRETYDLLTALTARLEVQKLSKESIEQLKIKLTELVSGALSESQGN